MADYNTVRRAGAATMGAQIDAGLRAHMNKVYGLMAVALSITGAMAYAFGTSEALMPLMFNIQTGGFSILGYVVLFAPLAMVLFFGAAVDRLSYGGAQLFFYVYAALVGMSISSIFLVYSGISIAKTFFVTAAAFAGLSLYGYTTKKDISSWGSFLIMGLIGLIIASIVNLFLQSSALEFAVSAIGVLIFAGLTAYDTQMIKTTYLQARHVGAAGFGASAGGDLGMEENSGKLAIMGALRLYLDFINLFLHLLRFMGSRE